MKFTYIVVGGGVAGASAIDGIRDIDKAGSILLLCGENHLPYHRPPLSKGLWTGKKKTDDIFVHEERFYAERGVTVRINRKISSIDPANHTIMDDGKNEDRFDKLLLATGGDPIQLRIPGGMENGVLSFRTLDDYSAVSSLCGEGASAVIIGGGFIGTELAAALSLKKVNVTMIFPESRPCYRIFPEDLGSRVMADFRERSVQIITRDKPSSIEKMKGKYRVVTEGGRRVECDFVIVGIGIAPASGLAQEAGLKVENGIRVNAFLQTSHNDIYAAGDNAFFPKSWSGESGRVEHWDNALNQGRFAGKNMAGASEPYTYIPYFFSDLFDIGYEAVGEVDSMHETFGDWQEENKKGVVYYLKENIVVGVLLCNVWGKLELARDLIKRKIPLDRESLRGAIQGR